MIYVAASSGRSYRGLKSTAADCAAAPEQQATRGRSRLRTANTAGVRDGADTGSERVAIVNADTARTHGKSRDLASRTINVQYCLPKADLGAPARKSTSRT
jgi:hypothetical protein